jgi:hypothetical protein
MVGWVLILFLLFASSAHALTVSPTNPRYFEDANGAIVYLNGGYFGCELQDNCFAQASGNNGPSNWAGVIADLTTYGGNLVRMWTSERGGFPGQIIVPMPWARSGTCCAGDGLNKWNLAALNSGTPSAVTAANVATYINSPFYFERLRARALDAKNRGFYVSVMLYHRFSVEGNWSKHPFHSANNVNGVNADTNGDGVGYENYSTANPGIAYQNAYTTAVLDAVADLDNVLIEICNECFDTAAANAWQQYVVDHIRSVEASRTIKHLIGFTAVSSFPSGGAGSDTPPITSTSHWYNNGSPTFDTAPPLQAVPNKPSILDSDHIEGATPTNLDWPWKTFTRGHGGTWNIYTTADHAPDATAQAIMTRMGQTTTMAATLDLRTAVPDTTTCGSTYGLKMAEQAICFIPGGGTSSVILTAPGTYTTSWFNPATNATTAGATVTDGTTTITPPFSGDAVAVFKRTIAPQPTGAITTDTTSFAKCTGCTSLTFTHTVGSGTNKALYIGVHTFAGANVSTVTVDGTAATLLGTATNVSCVAGTNCVAYLYRFLNPTAGPRTVVVTPPAAAHLSAGGLSLFGVHQTIPEGTPLSSVGTSAAPDLAGLSSATDHHVTARRRERLIHHRRHLNRLLGLRRAGLHEGRDGAPRGRVDLRHHL